jgi:hypothetical protein
MFIDRKWLLRHMLYCPATSIHDTDNLTLPNQPDTLSHAP